MFNIILLIFGFLLTKKKDGGESIDNSTNSNSSGSGISSSTWDKILLGGGLYLLYTSVKGAYDKNTQNTLFANADNNLNVTYAQQIHTAFNPSGFDFSSGMDGTDVSALMALAPQIKDWSGLQTVYAKLYNNEVLADRMSRELSSSDFNKFRALLGTGSSSGGGVIGSGSTGAVGTTKPIERAAPNAVDPKYTVPGISKNINGLDVVVLSGHTIYVRDKTGKILQTATGGTVLGTAKGWAKAANGAILVVYDRREHWYSFEDLHTVTANDVYTR